MNKANPRRKAQSAETYTPTLYSSFLPIPLVLPSLTPIPSSSKKPLTHITHYLYIRPHVPKRGDPGSLNRTIFIANLPVDMAGRDLRDVFSRWGVIENVAIGSSTMDALEQAVLGEQSDVEDSEIDEGSAAEPQILDEEDPTEPKFLGDGVGLSRSKRPRKPRINPADIPVVTPLPPLSARSLRLGHSHTAHVTFLDPSIIPRLMSKTPQPIRLTAYPSEPTGIDYYTRLHSTLRPPLAAVKEFADSSMARFDHLHSLLLSSRAKEKGAGALVDEDGFTVVVRGGRYGRTGGRGDGVGALGVGVAKASPKEPKKKSSVGAGLLEDFYRFQTVDRKRKGMSPFSHSQSRIS